MSYNTYGSGASTGAGAGAGRKDDKLARVSAQVDEVRGTMQKNIGMSVRVCCVRESVRVCCVRETSVVVHHTLPSSCALCSCEEQNTRVSSAQSLR